MTEHEMQRQKLNKDVEIFLKNGGKIHEEPTTTHTVESIKETYKDNPKNDYKLQWNEIL